MSENEWPYKYFKREEFCCKCGCGFCDINPELVEALDLVRDELKKPIYISSGCRCPKHNRAVEGSVTSSHLKGLAVDIYCEGTTRRYWLISLLQKYFYRIGIGKNFIHVDIDTSKQIGVMWLYSHTTGRWE